MAAAEWCLFRLGLNVLAYLGWDKKATVSKLMCLFKICDIFIHILPKFVPSHEPNWAAIGSDNNSAYNPSSIPTMAWFDEF